MGVKFYNIDSAPAVFDVVWCRWPNRGSKLEPGKARPILVLGVQLTEYIPTGEPFQMLTVQYGGDFEAKDVSGNLFIGEHQCRALGLHKSTVFRLDVGNRMKLPWGEKYFLPQGYVVGQGIVAGQLSHDQQKIVLACLEKRGLTFPPP